MERQVKRGYDPLETSTTSSSRGEESTAEGSQAQTTDIRADVERLKKKTSYSGALNERLSGPTVLSG